MSSAHCDWKKQHDSIDLRDNKHPAQHLTTHTANQTNQTWLKLRLRANVSAPFSIMTPYMLLWRSMGVKSAMMGANLVCLTARAEVPQLTNHETGRLISVLTLASTVSCVAVTTTRQTLVEARHRARVRTVAVACDALLTWCSTLSARCRALSRSRTVDASPCWHPSSPWAAPSGCSECGDCNKRKKTRPIIPRTVCYAIWNWIPFLWATDISDTLWWLSQYMYHKTSRHLRHKRYHTCKLKETDCFYLEFNGFLECDLQNFSIWIHFVSHFTDCSISILNAVTFQYSTYMYILYDINSTNNNHNFRSYIKILSSVIITEVTGPQRIICQIKWH